MTDGVTIHDIAKEYLGPKARGWYFSLEDLRVKLDKKGYSYYEYFAYLASRYADTFRYSNTRNSEKVLKRFKEYKEGLEEQARLNAYLDMETFEAHVRFGEAPEQVLTDEVLGITPLFRYVMALSLGLYEVAATYQDQAVQQSKENEGYLTSFESFKHLLPWKKQKEKNDPT